MLTIAQGGATAARGEGSHSLLLRSRLTRPVLTARASQSVTKLAEVIPVSESTTVTRAQPGCMSPRHSSWGGGGAGFGEHNGDQRRRKASGEGAGPAQHNLHGGGRRTLVG